MGVVECLHQLLQREDLPVVGRTPAEQRHIVYHRFRHKALVDEILIGGMAAPFAQLLVLLIGDQRAVYVHRHVPAKGFIQPVVLGRGGKIFVAPHHVGDPHQMVVDHICKIVGRKAVRLDQDHIVQFLIGHRDVPVDLVVEGGLSLVWDIEPDDPWLSRRKVGFHLFLFQSQAVLVIHHDVRPVRGNRGPQGVQTFLVAEAVIGIPLLHKLLRVFQI